MTHPRPRLGGIPTLAALTTAASVVASGLLSSAGAGPAAVASALAVAFVPYAVLVAHPLSLDGRTATRAGVLVALGVGLVLCAAPPVLSDDVFRYAWDGRVLLSGVDPYRFAPSDPALAHLRDAAFARINNPDVPTIYPPLAQLVFALAAIPGGVVAHKLVALAAHVATVPVVARLAGEPRGGHAALLFALNPLALAESALSGHVDAAAGLALALAVLALLRRRGVTAALLAAAAAGVKLVGLVLVPLLGRAGRRPVAVAALAAFVLVAPLVTAGYGTGAHSGAGEYAARWRGNDGLFAVIEGGAHFAVASIAEATGSPREHVSVPELRPVFEWLAGTPLDPWATQAGEKKEIADRADLPTDFVAGVIARLLALAMVFGLAVACARSRMPALPAARLVVLAVLLLSPQLHPWYVVWLLPLEIAAGGLAGVVLGAVVLVAYAPLAGWEALRSWVEAPAARAVEHGLVLAVLWWERPWLGMGRVGHGHGHGHGHGGGMGRTVVESAYIGTEEHPSSHHRGPSQCTPSPSR